MCTTKTHLHDRYSAVAHLVLDRNFVRYFQTGRRISAKGKFVRLADSSHFSVAQILLIDWNCLYFDLGETT